MKEFSDRLKELREETGLSMKQLSERIGVSDASVSNWENGIVEPKASYVIKLAEFFECTTDYILGRTDDFETPQGANNFPFIKLNTTEKAILDNFRKLDLDMQALTQNTLKYWTEIKKKDNE